MARVQRLVQKLGFAEAKGSDSEGTNPCSRWIEINIYGRLHNPCGKNKTCNKHTAAHSIEEGLFLYVFVRYMVEGPPLTLQVVCGDGGNGN